MLPWLSVNVVVGGGALVVGVVGPAATTKMLEFPLS